MSLLKQAQAELAQKGSHTACASNDLADTLKAAVLARMTADPKLTFARVAAQIGDADPSTVRKWLQGTRLKIRSGNTRTQGLTIGKSVKVATWVEKVGDTGAVPPEVPPRQTALLIDDLREMVMDKATSTGLSLRPAELAAATGLPANVLEDLLRGKPIDINHAAVLQDWSLSE